MRNFDSALNRSLDSKSSSKDEDLPKVENLKKIDESKELIENQEEFWAVFIEAKNQFEKIKSELNKGATLEELKEINKEIHYLTFKDYLRYKPQPVFISDNLEFNKDGYAPQIQLYDDHVEEIRNFKFHSKKDLKNFFKSLDDVFKVKNLEE